MDIKSSSEELVVTMKGNKKINSKTKLIEEIMKSMKINKKNYFNRKTMPTTKLYVQGQFWAAQGLVGLTTASKIKFRTNKDNKKSIKQ